MTGESKPSKGELAILHATLGHATLRFDDNETAERANKVIQQMMSYGYTILVQDEHGLSVVKGYDPAHREYILAEEKSPPAAKGEKQEEASRSSSGKVSRQNKAKKGRRVKAREASATAIPPVAGG